VAVVAAVAAAWVLGEAERVDYSERGQDEWREDTCMVYA
jgi:hypothetical protein